MSPIVLQLIEQMILLAIQNGPELAEEGALVLSIIKSGAEPTAEQSAQISAGLDKTHAALAAALADRTR